MISRSTLIGALVVVELVIVGFAVKAIAGGGTAVAPGPFAFSHGASAFGRPEAGSATTLNRSFAAG
ncbi:MAG TPA: hypothetical protein VHS26_04775, partial [Solirubrobacteraceae bacterium]|nr:hypothetical protein [Solirubrobacteraceae bacterium]